MGFYKDGNEILCSIKGRILLTDAQLLPATFGLHCVELLKGYTKWPLQTNLTCKKHVVLEPVSSLWEVYVVMCSVFY